MSNWKFATALALVAAMGGCAATGAGDPAIGAATPASEFSTAAPAERPVRAAAYVPTDDERKLTCKKLTGTIQVKILQLRGYADRPQPSALAKSAHQTINPVLGAGTVGSDPAAERARERARVDAYNGLLAEKKCKTFDIEADLKGTGTPSPVSATQPGAKK